MTLKDAEQALREGQDDTLGESAIARQAARVLLSAKHRGGWIAGRVDVQSFFFGQTGCEVDVTEHISTELELFFSPSMSLLCYIASSIPF